MFKTKADLLVELLETKKQISLEKLPGLLGAKKEVIMLYARYLEDAGILRIDYTPTTTLTFLKNPEVHVEFRDEKLVLNRVRILLEMDNLNELKNLIYELYTASQQSKNDHIQHVYDTVHDYLENYFKNVKDSKNYKATLGSKDDEIIRELEHYTINIQNFVMHTKIIKHGLELVPYYIISVLEYGAATRTVIDRIKQEVIQSITLDTIKEKKYEEERIRNEFQSRLSEKIEFLMSEMPNFNLVALSEYITITTLGMGDIELILHDPQIEEIVINNAHEPVMVYHDKYKWLKTNIMIENEDTIKHYATLAGRLVNKNITLLSPLLDAHLVTGDRVNATLEPISTKGNTITIRKFATKPWTITRLIKNGTIDVDTASLVWLAIQYELSMIIVGGTGSGKTSTLNVVSNFLQPTQRIVSIEDTRELTLPESLHWIPMQSRLPNPEGQGSISMLDLVVNSLRMRPDRILVGEIRRKAEAEVMFEAMHTGHSVYATLHANSVSEALLRLTNPPIDLPKNVLNALSLLLVQNRNRRTGTRKTFQLAEILESGDYNLIYEYDVEKDVMVKVSEPTRLYETLRLFTGMSRKDIENDIAEKKRVLQYLCDENIDDVNKVGYIISDYYSNKDYLFKRIFPGKKK